MDQFERYFEMRKKQGESQANTFMKFDCEKYIRLTPQEKIKLYTLKIFRRFKWYVL